MNLAFDWSELEALHAEGLLAGREGVVGLGWRLTLVEVFLIREDQR